MNNKIKLKISNNAYNELLNLFNYDDSYDCLKFTYNHGCCKEAKVSLTLDNIENNILLDKIEDINIAYDKELVDKVKEITLIYTEKGFMVKATAIDNSNSCKSNCGGCNKGCNKGCNHKSM